MLGKVKEIWKQIFELYKEMPCLWDTTNKDYLNRDTRNQSLEILLDKYKVIDESANISILKKKIENMRTSYKREFKKVKASLRAGSEVYVPTLWYYDWLSFLDERKVQTRRGRGTTQSSDEEENADLAPNAPRPPLPAIKKQRISFVRPEETLPEALSKSMHNVAEEWEIIGKSIGFQMKDMDKKQQAIAHKLISDTIFYAKMGKLSEDSFIALRSTPISRASPDPVQYLASSYTSPDSMPSPPAQTFHPPHAPTPHITSPPL